MNYEKDRAIDPSQLDVEWLEQANLMYKYTKISAQASKEWDIAKENLSVVKAGLDRKLRADPDKYKLAKVTEPVIFAAITEHKKYQAANTVLIEAQYEFNMARAAVHAVEQRKSALENLVRLFGQQYFAGPKVPRNISGKWDDRISQKDADKTIKIGSKKK